MGLFGRAAAASIRGAWVWSAPSDWSRAGAPTSPPRSTTRSSNGRVGSVGTSSLEEGEVDAGQQPEGFSTITARITETDGRGLRRVRVARRHARGTGRGLMGVTDLGEAAGMVFRFDEPIDGSFYMFQTPTPLSIAWFAPDGGASWARPTWRHVSTPRRASARCTRRVPSTTSHSRCSRVGSPISVSAPGHDSNCSTAPRPTAARSRPRSRPSRDEARGRVWTSPVANPVTPPRDDGRHETPSRDRHRPR